MQSRDEVEGLHKCRDNVRLFKHRKTVFYCFYKITSSKNYNAGKDKKKDSFIDQNVSSYNISLTMAFLN